MGSLNVSDRESGMEVLAGTRHVRGDIIMPCYGVRQAFVFDPQQNYLETKAHSTVQKDCV